MEQGIETNNPKKSEEDLDGFMLLLMKYAEQIFSKEKINTFLSGNLDIQQLKESFQDDTKKKIYLNGLKTSTEEQWKNLASISALAATLLVIATFNDRIFPYSPIIKILPTVLLVIIPLSLIGFYMNFNIAQNQALNELEKIVKKQQGQDKLSVFKQIREISKQRILSYIPVIVNILVIGVICMIICLIWFTK